MKDKVFENVEAILAGKRMKFLDPNRKAVLAIPLAPFKLWHTYWSFESDGQEAYPTMATLVATSKLSKPTIIKAREYLLKTGWLIQLKGTAASRYIKASNGSWNISVYRVNDPTTKAEEELTVKNLYQVTVKNADGQESLPLEEMTVKNLTGQKSLPNGASTGTSAFAGTVANAGTLAPPAPATERSETLSLRESKPNSLRETEPAPSETKPEKPTTSNKGVHPVKSPKDSDPSELEETPAKNPMDTPPITVPPPAQAEGKYQCPACDLTHRNGYYVAEHIEKEHPEQGQQSFEITCPEDGCYWSVWWNKVQDDKAARDADLLNHLEVQHNPDSPRYNPWEPCPECGVNLPRESMVGHQPKCKGATQ